MGDGERQGGMSQGERENERETFRDKMRERGSAREIERDRERERGIHELSGMQRGEGVREREGKQSCWEQPKTAGVVSREGRTWVGSELRD